MWREEKEIKNTTLNKSETRLFKRFVKSIPMAICGLALGLAALGNLLKPAFEGYGDIVRYICGGLSFAVLLVFALKLFFDYSHVKEELKTPVPASVLPTATMALMLLSAYISPCLPDAAVAVWYTSVVVHICLMAFFFRRFIADLKLSTVFPSWFVVFVGIATASVTAPAMGALIIGQAAFYAGFVLYFICLILVVIRMTEVKLFPEPVRPTIAIFAAPIPLLIVGYFSSFVEPFAGIEGAPAPNSDFIYFMLAAATVSYIYVLAILPPLLIKKFYPAYSSFTFPLVISALSFRLGADFISAAHEGFGFLVNIADVTQWIAVAAVVFVLLHYIRYFFYELKF